MPKFHYNVFGKPFGVESVVDEKTYDAARDMFAESLGIPANSLEYLVQYGVNQTVQDAMAGPKKAAKDEGGDEKSAMLTAATKRIASIMDGTCGVRGGGFRVTDPLEKAVRDIVDESLKKAAKKEGKKLPKGADYQKLRDKTYADHKSQIDKLAKERVAAESAIKVEIKL